MTIFDGREVIEMGEALWEEDIEKNRRNGNGQKKGQGKTG